MAIKPWEKIGKSTTLATKFGKNLVVEEYHNPNTGQDLEYALIGQRNWSVVLAITEDGNVLVVTQYKAGCGCVIDELAAGTTNFEDEEPKVVAARELREETGYVATEMISLGFAWPMTANSHTKFFCFLAIGCHKAGAAKLDENENIETRLVPLDRWIDMVTSGQISEPSAVMATMRALPHLGYTITRPKRRRRRR